VTACVCLYYSLAPIWSESAPCAALSLACSAYQTFWYSSSSACCLLGAGWARLTACSNLYYSVAPMLSMRAPFAALSLACSAYQVFWYSSSSACCLLSGGSALDLSWARDLAGAAAASLAGAASFLASS